MDRILFSGLSFFITAGFIAGSTVVSSQTIIAQQDFETVPAVPEAGFNITGGSYFTTSSVAGDRPASASFYNGGARSFGVNNGSATLSSNSNLDVSNYTEISVKLKIASFSIGSFLNGSDAGDFVLLEVSTDGGSNWSQELKVTGNSNAFWNYSSTNAIARYDGNNTATVFSPAGGGNRTTDGYSTLIIDSIPQVTQLRLRITLFNNSVNEQWVIDDLQLIGTWSPPLPVKLLYFRGTATENKNLLQWVTATETNNDYFTIERSGDNMLFTEAGRVPGKIYSNTSTAYFFMDTTVPSESAVYYRLKQTDRDGTYSFSDIIVIEPMNRNKMSLDGVIPNPFTERIIFDFSMPRSEKVLITLTDFDGKKIYSQQHQGNSGYNRFELSGLDDLIPGIYLLWLQRNSEVTVVRVIRH